jgi:methylthioribose-1-phosphate isomerase
MAGGLLAIKYERGKLELLDQRLLPFETTYLPVTSPQAAYDAIKSMVVRGAPAIGCTAALATAVWLAQHGSGAQFESAADAAGAIQRELDHLVTRCSPNLRPVSL